jgi:hypothetical protein
MANIPNASIIARLLTWVDFWVEDITIIYPLQKNIATAEAIAISYELFEIL